jgi:probable HAF family extracellular repeat protein
MVNLLKRLIICAVIVTAALATAGSALAAPPAGWIATDLGTLGGSSSHATAVNNAGVVVGDSDTGSGTIHAFSRAPGGTMHDLGTLPGGSFSTAVAINASGQIAGYGDIASGAMHAIRWSAAGAATDLGDLGGGDSTAVAINDAGTVAGTSTTAAGQQHAFLRGMTGNMVDLGTLGGTWSSATAISASGQVVGSSLLAGDLDEHAFRASSAGVMADIGTTGFESKALAINSAGSAVGFRSETGNPPSETGFLRTTGLTLIGGAASFTSANAINTAGQVVGVAPAPTDATVQSAFSWTTAGLVNIGTLGGTFGAAYAVNTAGQVVGTSTIADDAASHAFYWAPGGAILDLGTVGLGTDSFGVALNDTGTVVGLANTDTGETHAIVWTHGVDTTPPVITSVVTGALGADGWYTGNVSVAWTVTDAESAITSAPCPASTVTADTAGTTFTCTATSGGGTATQSVTIKRATPIAPVVGVTPPGATKVTSATAPVIPKTRTISVSTKLSPKLKAGRQRVLVTLHAPAGATASGTIQLKAKLSAGKKAKLKNVGSAAFKLGAGQTKTFTIMLNAGGKARLVRIGNLRVSVIIAARDAAGKVRPTNRSITVKGTKIKS